MPKISTKKMAIIMGGYVQPKCKYALEIDTTEQTGAYECNLANIKNEPIGIYVWGVCGGDVCPYHRFGMWKCQHYVREEKRGEQ